MRIGIYIGSFNPPHLGHKSIANYLLENNYVDKIIIIATGNYWDKNDIIDINHRINMLKYYGNENIIIDDRRNDFTYTYEILKSLKLEYPQDELYLIIGADNLIKFNLWKEVDQILENKVLVLPRNNIEANSYIRNYKNKNNFIMVNNFEPIYISSSIIREKLKSNDLGYLKKYIDSNILNYIINNNLYCS